MLLLTTRVDIQKATPTVSLQLSEHKKTPKTLEEENIKRMNTGTQTESDETTKARETLRTKSQDPLTIESLAEALSTIEDSDRWYYGENIDDVADGEEVIGEIELPARNFFTLAMMLHKEAVELGEKSEKAMTEISLASEGDKKIDPEVLAAFHHDGHRISELLAKAETYTELGWLSVKDNIGWTCEERLGLRRKWQLVRQAQEDRIPHIEVIGISLNGPFSIDDLI